MRKVLKFHPLSLKGVPRGLIEHNFPRKIKCILLSQEGACQEKNALTTTDFSSIISRFHGTGT